MGRGSEIGDQLMWCIFSPRGLMLGATKRFCDAVWMVRIWKHKDDQIVWSNVMIDR